MEKIFCGKRDPVKVGTARVWLNGKILSPERSLKVWNHSPDGFQWGYGGSGPAQLALGLLLEVTGSVRRSRFFYQQFKWQVVAALPDQWVLTSSEIETWLQNVPLERVDGKDGENGKKEENAGGGSRGMETTNSGENAGGGLSLLAETEDRPL